MEGLVQDLRYACRSLAGRPGFAAVTVLVLGLGIGANTAIFSVVDAVLLRPLPFAQPDRLVWAYGSVRDGPDRASVSPLDYFDYRAQNRSFAQLGAAVAVPVPLSLTGASEPRRVVSAVVSGNYFDALGVKPALGRAFAVDNERPEHNQVVVLGHALWQGHFGGDPAILERRITLDGVSAQVLGVMPPGFKPSRTAELWVPINAGMPAMKQRRAHFLRPVGRLLPGVTLAQAQADVGLVARRLEEQFPDTNRGWSLALVPLREVVVGDIRPTLRILFGAVLFVLLIACANAANLLLVRAASRRKELAIRTALGAGRLRIARQVLAESVLLAVAGGALGVLAAAWGIDLLVALAGQNIPPMVEVGIDGRVLWFTLAVSLLTGLLFGLAPALSVARSNLTPSLNQSGRSDAPSGGGRNRTRNTLVVLESAVAVVLLVGAGLLLKSFWRLHQASPGFEARSALTFRLDLSQGRYAGPGKASSFFADLEARLAGLPGVEAVGTVTELPLSGQPNDVPVFVEGRAAGRASRERPLDADFRRVNADYFRAMGIPLLRGRGFTAHEVRQDARVVIVSESLARTAFPGEDPLGKRLVYDAPERSFQVIGVVGDVQHRALDGRPFETSYLPTQDVSWGYVVLRTAVDPLALAPAVREQVHAVDPGQPIGDLRALEQLVHESAAAPRFRTTLLGLFAGLALLLAAIGIYSVVSFSVARRTHEIGVRMALGAWWLQVLHLVVGESMRLVLLGVALGLAGALALTRVLTSVLFGVGATDPSTFVAVALLLGLVALAACWIPARRATRVDPMVALRSE